MKDDTWQFDYITNFSYQGSVFPEMAKDVDFDFTNRMLTVLYLPSMPISADIDFFKLWQGNFLAYLESGAFDNIEVNWDC